ncbi:MAG: hypothetical protein LH660_14310 [Phormidesmis sp. CAN_BIN36]|nr:hypothetical protein [Phormidesmis sp. CAN_BIN36]
MTLLSPQLAAYQTLRQQQRDQIDPALGHLHHHIDQQLNELQQQEQALLDAQGMALEPLRSIISADARCLLPTDSFGQSLTTLLKHRRVYGLRSLSSLTLETDLNNWLLGTLPVPLEIVAYETLRDDGAYNEENYYTDYRYNLTARLGRWEKTLSISTASLHPGNPMNYYLRDLSSQHRDVVYRLLGEEYCRPEVIPQPEFPDLALTDEQVLQLKQEMSCLLAFVGHLFNLQSRVEHFRHPQQQSGE